MSNNKRIFIETLQKKRTELEAQREKNWADITRSIHEIDDALTEMGVWTPKEPVHHPIYDDENPDYIKASAEEI